MAISFLIEAEKRIPQKTKSGKTRPASKHSDLYTDEDPKGTITGLGFKDTSTARDGITKINKAKTTHAHKVQATLVMKQRSKAAIERTKDPEKKKKLRAAYKIWSDKLEQLKRKTKSMKKESLLTEGRYDAISRQLAKYTLNAWKDDFEYNEPTSKIEFEVGPGKDLDYSDLTFTYIGKASFIPQGDFYKNGYSKGAVGEVGVVFIIPKAMLPQSWERIYNDLIEIIRHEIEHQTQAGVNVKPGKQLALDTIERAKAETSKSFVDYLNLDKEIDANLQGLYLRAKKERKPFKDVVDSYLRNYIKLSDSDIEIVKNEWNKRLKALSLPSLNESYEKVWPFKEGMLSLTKYMIDNGLNIQPLPTIKVIDDDDENASHLLGNTAYYDPNKKCVVLYTKDRHPKDVLRSFAHEMIHHMQNLEGRLHNIRTVNVNEDDILKELEREAFMEGNMMFRSWENTVEK